MSYLISIKIKNNIIYSLYCIVLNYCVLYSLLSLMHVILGSSAMLNGHCNDPEEYDRISCSAASETQVIFLMLLSSA